MVDTISLTSTTASFRIDYCTTEIAVSIGSIVVLSQNKNILSKMIYFEIKMEKRSNSSSCSTHVKIVTDRERHN
jgi:hypothetical protein